MLVVSAGRQCSCAYLECVSTLWNKNRLQARPCLPFVTHVSVVCQFGNFLTRFSNFSDTLSDLLSKEWLVTNLAIIQSIGEKMRNLFKYLIVLHSHAHSMALQSTALGSLPLLCCAHRQQLRCVWSRDASLSLSRPFWIAGLGWSFSLKMVHLMKSIFKWLI